MTAYSKSVASLSKTRELLKMEYEYDKQSYNHQSNLVMLEKKCAAGLCRYPVTVVKSYYNSINQFVVELSNKTTEQEDEKEDSFEYGKAVQFFYIDLNGKNKPLKVKGQVSYATQDVLVVALQGQDALGALGSGYDIGVELCFDETSYSAMFEALDKVIEVKDGRLFDLRETLLGNRPAGFLTFAPIRFPWLNQSQEEAVNQILRAKDVAIVHGPPGTGKTTTLVEAIYETLRRESQVMVCAQSNMAVDWISEQLSDRGVNVLRIGNPSRVDDKMLACTYEKRFESHPQYPALWAMRRTIRELYSKDKDKARSLKERAESVELEIRESIFQETRVVACTLVGAANKLLYGQRYQSLFIDEAAQALEPACWIAIAKAQRVILAGDHKQLPPTIKSIEAERLGLGKTLMEKLIAHIPSCVSMLTIQYRMNEEIMKISSDWFYDGKLIAAPEVKYRSILDYDNHIEWIDTSGMDFKESYVAKSAGRINREEAHFVVKKLTEYINKVGADRVIEEQISFGIISPYKAQVYFIRHLLKGNKTMRPFRKLISVNTVDGFQGRERDVIILSLVRSNSAGNIGFLSELRRMNVAITRARMKLIIVSDSETLTSHPFYKKIFEAINNENYE